MSSAITKMVASTASALGLPVTIDRYHMVNTRIFSPRLDPLRDMYRGKRCFVIGNGPSLKAEHLDMLIGEYSFAMNRISMIFDKTKWRPSFYSMVTVAIHGQEWAESAREVVAMGIPAFVWWPFAGYLCDPKNVPENVYIMECSQDRTATEEIPLDSWWSWDIGARVSKHGTSMLPTLQIAVFMGFNPIYLVGADNYWKSFDWEEDKDPNHFDDTYWSKLELADREIRVDDDIAHRYTRQCTTAHELAHRVTSQRGINIYNATDGGSLEVYPRVNLQEVLSSNNNDIA